MENISYNKLSFEEKKSIIEALIFAADAPQSFKNIFALITSEGSSSVIDKEKLEGESFEEFTAELEEIIKTINSELTETGRPYKILEIGGGLQFATRNEFGRFVHHYYKTKLSRRLSNAALEVLSIVAYRQPVTKAEIEQIRGVNSNEVVNSLLDKSFIKIAGRKNVLGRPLVFEVTDDFLRSFGLNSLEDLPKMKDFEELVREEFAKEDDGIFTLDVSEAIIEKIQAEVEEQEYNEAEIQENETT